MIHQAPMYHAQAGPFSGLLFAVGDDLLFAMVDDVRLYHVSQLPTVTLGAQVPEAQAEYLYQHILEPRMQAQQRRVA